MIQIVIHRKLGKDAAHEFAEMYTKLVKKYGNLVRGRQNGLVDIGKNIRISFYAGDYYRMAGTRPNIYNTDDLDADKFLMVSASKVGGTYMTMDEILEKLLGGEEVEG